MPQRARQRTGPSPVESGPAPAQERQGRVRSAASSPVGDPLSARASLGIVNALTFAAPESSPARAEQSAIWAAWAQRSADSGPDRGEALGRLNAWVEADDPEAPLSLENLVIGSLPDRLPNTVRILEISGCGLDELPRNLPASLREIDVTHNRLRSLPESLPESLQSLDVSDNYLDRLPDHWPASLQSLDLSRNPMRQIVGPLPESLVSLLVEAAGLNRLPEHLPPLLRALDVTDNELSGLPEHLPSNLRDLLASANLLTRLPQRLPDSLEQLEVADNRLLLQLPDELPESLHILVAAGCSLTRLPARFPASLMSLSVEDNPLTSLPESILQLHSGAQVTISANRLSEAARNGLQAAAGAASYNGPTIDFDMGGSDVAQVRELADEIQAWLAEATNDNEARPIRHGNIAEGPQARDFSAFLGRLRETQEYQHPPTRPQFQQRVRRLIEDCQNQALTEFRDTCLALAQEAVATCGDRVALAFLDMETQAQLGRIERAVLAGTFDQSPADLAAQGKRFYQLSELRKEAIDKSATLNLVDQIEVHLGYITALSREFNLPVQMETMLYPRHTNIDETDIGRARTRLSQDENSNGLVAFLSNFSPMDRYLARTHPADYESISSMVDERLETRKAELYSRLEALDLQTTEGEESSRALMREFNALEHQTATEVKGELIRRLAHIPST